MRIFPSNPFTFCGVALVLAFVGIFFSTSDLPSQTVDDGTAEPELPTPHPRRILMVRNGLSPAPRWCLMQGAPLYKSRDIDSRVIGRLEYLEVVNLAEVEV